MMKVMAVIILVVVVHRAELSTLLPRLSANYTGSNNAASLREFLIPARIFLCGSGFSLTLSEVRLRPKATNGNPLRGIPVGKPDPQRPDSAGPKRTVAISANMPSHSAQCATSPPISSSSSAVLACISAASSRLSTFSRISGSVFDERRLKRHWSNSIDSPSVKSMQRLPG